MHGIPAQWPWFVVGPLIGLVVAGMFAVTNRPIGASGSYAQVTDKILGKPMKEPWRLTFMGGVIIGGFLVAWLGGGLSDPLAYGLLGQRLSPGLLTAVLFFGGVMMGFGARWMGGCTSGHGLCGTSMRSLASFAATASFFATAVVVTFLLHLVTGGWL
ncbi:MAG: YeeE/YedE family protein [Alicyclobacillus sp.]|nr:YeeE/YedE family protein [Alicyclobacillus sp.]